MDAIIHELGLEQVQHEIIGGEFVRGVSGGERKRASIGVELVTDPSFLFCDEPTSARTLLRLFSSFQCATPPPPPHTHTHPSPPTHTHAHT